MDVAGEVAEVGKNVTNFKLGDRVLGHALWIATRDNRDAGFQEYTAIQVVVAGHLPSNITFEEGSLLPMAVDTAAAGLYDKDLLGLQHPSLSPKPTGQTLLIWGGSSSVGACTIQLARASGYEVFTTASPRNHGKVKQLGASQVFDQGSSSVVQDITAALQGKDLVGAYDAIGEDSTQRASAEILVKANASKKFLATVLSPVENLGVAAKWLIAVTVASNEVGPAIWRNFLPQALESGQFVPCPEVVVVGHGLEKLAEASKLQKSGMSYAKPVVTVG